MAHHSPSGRLAAGMASGGDSTMNIPPDQGVGSIASLIQQQRPQYSDYRFELRVVQQPQRARMCGFGDKVDPSTLDISFFVVHADLWAADQSSQQNLVLHPSVSGTGGGRASSEELKGAGILSNQDSLDGPPTYRLTKSSSPKMVEIRNLIGSPSTSACKLYDTENNLGVYFIFQDLSIRTEGNFTLRFSFMDLGTADNQLNVGQDYVRHFTFSDVFTVYSAKKFPGMIESTPLSKCFVKQGIKISVRKESSRAKQSSDQEK
ncbi:hypothetical protein IWQ62_001233 [Dispira parvispora]|uniref:Velvet domain-containing protein n=1 Tax=Dispira parvispora TaxID=1520584 RepID=A0A9W8AU34_9FUNG|nr:hypothetical protein IWQ62_001233 [Dispira parvispora]